jgi:hypothetical protein
MLVAITVKRLGLTRSRYQTLQVFGFNLCKEAPFDTALSCIPTARDFDQNGKQSVLL